MGYIKGFGTEVTLLILYYSFRVLVVEKIDSRQLMSITASIKTLEKCRCKKEGMLRKAVLKNCSYHDLNLMFFIRENIDKLMNKYKLK